MLVKADALQSFHIVDCILLKESADRQYEYSFIKQSKFLFEKQYNTFILS